MPSLKEIIASLKGVETRPYQVKIVEKIHQHFVVEGLKSILMDSPVGSGKTTTALLAIKYMKSILPDLRVGWTAMRRNLLVQAEEENRNKGFNLNIDFFSTFTNDVLPKVDVLVVDEAQHDGANTSAHVHNQIKPRYTLGLSGTPFRTDRVKLCFQKVIREAGIQELIDQKYLSEYSHYSIPEWSAKAVCDHYLRDKRKWGKSIMFFHRLEECEEARNYLMENGVLADTVTGSTNREEQLDRFKHGVTDVLMNCFILSEGFNFPALKTVFCKPSCKLVTIQMGGRVFRKHPHYPLKNLVQCHKTRWPFMRTAKPKMQHKWEDGVWINITPNDFAEQAAMKVPKLLSKIKTTMPEYITSKQKPRRRNIRLR